VLPGILTGLAVLITRSQFRPFIGVICLRW